MATPKLPVKSTESDPTSQVYGKLKTSGNPAMKDAVSDAYANPHADILNSGTGLSAQQKVMRMDAMKRRMQKVQ